MAYIKNNWVDQSVERPKTYEMTNNSDGSVTLIDSFGLVSELGTPVNADNMNHIEEGVEGCAIRKHNLTEVFEAMEWVTAIIDNEKKLFQSKRDNNQGHPVTDADWWQEVSLGGGGLKPWQIGMDIYVDETDNTQRLLNGQIVTADIIPKSSMDRLLRIKAVSPQLFITEENWQAEKTLSVFNQVGKFVLNYASDGVTVESIRLPAIVNIRGLFDLQNSGMTVKAGLPNVIQYIGRTEYSTETPPGAIITEKKDGASFEDISFSGSSLGYITIDLSKGNPIFGASNTVQEEAIQYSYFIQIAAGSETRNNIINDIELNNPYTLLESKYSNELLYNLSFLQASGNFEPKGSYPKVYEALMVEYNTEINPGDKVELPSSTTYIKRGLSVKLSTEAYTDSDFVLNPVNGTFRLALLNGEEILPSQVKEPITVNLSTVAGTQSFIAKQNGWFCFNLEGSTIRINNSASILTGTINGSAQLNIFCSRGQSAMLLYDSISKVHNAYFVPAKGNGYLYYYVGETVQGANLINAAVLSEGLVNKVDKANTKWATDACIPDYSAGITRALPTQQNPFIAPTNGLISIFSLTESTQIIYIDNVACFLHVDSVSNVDTQSQIFPIAKGSSVYITNIHNYKENSLVFFPLKGAK